MRNTLGFLALVFLIWAEPAQAADYFADGPHPVAVEDSEFTDAKRKRTVPYRLYRPAVLSERYPVVVFSHGLGGSREVAAYLGHHLASHGYLAFHIQHPGSDESVRAGLTKRAEIRRSMYKAAQDRRAAIDRFKDVGFVIDRVKKLHRGRGVLGGHVDMKRIGFSGHSYGARTTLVAAGEKMGKRSRSFKDKRIRAAIAYSGAPSLRAQDVKQAFSRIKIPMFHMTGTKDNVPGFGSTAEDRKVPYQAIAAPNQYLLVLESGDHGVFNGNRMRRNRPKPTDEQHWRLIKGASLAFWQAYLNKDADARRWLDEDFARILGREGTFERK